MRRVPFSPKRTMLGVEGPPFKHAIAAELFGEGVDQPLSSPGAPGLLIRYAGQRQPAAELGAQTKEIDVGKQRCGGAALHVDATAAVHLAGVDGAAPGIARPGLAWTRREYVDVAIEDEMGSPARPGKGADDVGQFRPRGAVFGRHAVGLEGIVQECRRLARVSRRIW